MTYKTTLITSIAVINAVLYAPNIKSSQKPLIITSKAVIIKGFACFLSEKTFFQGFLLL